MCRFLMVVAALGVALSCPLPASAQIDLSLNLDYAVNTNSNSGGNWTLVGKADPSSFGIAGISVTLSGINTAMRAGPRGVVNSDSDAAGFRSFTTFELAGGSLQAVVANQSPLSVSELGMGEQNVFYGVGSLSNGSPAFPDQEMGTNSVGPEITSLSNTSGVPWGVPDSDYLGDEDWDIAVPLAHGTFLEGEEPDFDLASGVFGSVFTSLGTSAMAGSISCGAHDPVLGGSGCDEPSDETEVTTLVRDDLIAGSGGDYNRDGVVNAADYVVWRNTEGTSVPTPGDGADGNMDGMVTQADYTYWAERFGNIPGAGSSTAAVPEPTAACLALLGVAGTLFSRRKRANPAPRLIFGKNSTTA